MGLLSGISSNGPNLSLGRQAHGPPTVHPMTVWCILHTEISSSDLNGKCLAIFANNETQIFLRVRPGHVKSWYNEEEVKLNLPKFARLITSVSRKLTIYPWAKLYSTLFSELCPWKNFWQKFRWIIFCYFLGVFCSAIGGNSQNSAPIRFHLQSITHDMRKK